MGARATFNNAGQGGSVTFWQAMLMDSVIGNADILFWEFALTDAQFGARVSPTHLGGAWDRAMATHDISIELFLKAALELESKPAVILVYFWDAAKWPMQQTVWEQHRATVERFHREYGLDISVLLAGELALGALQQVGVNVSDMEKGGAVMHHLWSAVKNRVVWDHHPSKWVHERTCDALEFALLNLTLSKASFNSKGSTDHHRHSHARQLYQPSANATAHEGTHDRFSTRRWPFLANMTASISLFRPSFGQSRNGGHGDFASMLEEGAKNSTERTDRKIDAVVPYCSEPRHYRAWFGTPPPGTAWKALQLTLKSLPRTASALVLAISGPTLLSGDAVESFVVHRPVTDSSVWIRSINICSAVVDLELEFLSSTSWSRAAFAENGLRWSAGFNISACMQPAGQPLSRRASRGAVPQGAVPRDASPLLQAQRSPEIAMGAPIGQNAGLRWTIAFAV